MMNKYLSLSKNDFYSAVLIFPLFILYEFLGYINNYESHFIIRNSADVYIRHFFLFFGEHGKWIYSLFLIFFLLFIFFRNKDLFMSAYINIQFLFFMIFESLIHSLSLLIVMNLFSNVLLSSTITNNNIFEKIYLSIGAGLWEEILFRYILITSLFFIINKIFIRIHFKHYLIIVCISSTIFSYFHFLGPFGDSISLSFFVYRFVAGSILSFIFIFRGIGIAVYTHTFYDLYLVIS